MTLSRIAAFRLVTQAPARALAFYEALGFAAGAETTIPADEMAMLGIAGGGRRRTLALGPARVDLDWFAQGGRPYPATTGAAWPGFQHLALVTDDVERDWVRAHAAGATAISRDGPVTLPAGAGGVTAIKFHDPDGHPLELISFPDADRKGWRGSGLMGIDHSAIVALDRAASIAFYEQAGLSQGRAGLNHGPTQAALDGLEAPLVDVVPMLPAAAPPHVELLRYRTPAPTPARWATNDVAATRIVWHGDGPALLRDPDGHLHQMLPG